MAQRRMLTLQVIDSDSFVDLPLSAQGLYFHLAMRADDDGFMNSPRKVQRMIRAAEEDLQILIERRFLIAFDDGVVVIRHWKMHNYIKADRYRPTQYQEHFSRLRLNDDGTYTEKGTKAEPDRSQNGAKTEPDRNQTGAKTEPKRNQTGTRPEHSRRQNAAQAEAQR